MKLTRPPPHTTPPLERWPDLKVGDVLDAWFDTGAFGVTLIYFKVVKIGERKIKVVDEYGGESWRYVSWFNKRLGPRTEINAGLLAEIESHGWGDPPK